MLEKACRGLLERLEVAKAKAAENGEGEKAHEKQRENGKEGGCGDGNARGALAAGIDNRSNLFESFSVSHLHANLYASLTDALPPSS